MKNRMNKNMRTWIILATLIVVAILAALWATSTFWFPRFPWRLGNATYHLNMNIPGDIEFFYTAKTVVSTINVTLSIFLLLTYISIYRKTRSEFTIGLIIFSMVFSSECSCLQSLGDLGFRFSTIWFRTICLVARPIYTWSTSRTAISQRQILGMQAYSSHFFTVNLCSDPGRSILIPKQQ